MAGQDEVESAPLADEPWQADRPEIDQRHAEAPAEDAENRRLRRDPQVAPQRKFEPARHRMAFDRGDHRLGQDESGRTHRRPVAVCTQFASDVVSKFDDGTLELAGATTQIDAILSPGETQAVLAEQKKMRDAMRQAAASAGAGGYAGRNGSGGRRSADAGRFLLSVLADPAKFRAAVRPPSG